MSSFEMKMEGENDPTNTQQSNKLIMLIDFRRIQYIQIKQHWLNIYAIKYIILN